MTKLYKQYPLKIEIEYLANLFKRDKFTHSREEKILEELKMPTIDGMLSYWQKHNQFILKKVPDNRLLVIKTQNISHKIDAIVKFAGLDNIPGKINSHAYKARKKHHILSKIDTNFLEDKLNKYSLEFVQW